MVNPGAFQGHRKEFLVGQKPYYASAVTGGYVRDALAIIQRRFFKRFPIEMSLDNEPSLEELAAVDDEQPDDEHPDIDSELEGEELETELKRRHERGVVIEKRKGQISRWLQYQYMKDTDIDPRDGVGLTPNRILLFKLTGKGIDKPRQKAPKNLWRKTQKDNIEKQAKEEAKKMRDRGQKVDLITLRDRFARQGFEALSKEEREEWKAKAMEEHREALAQFERDCSQPPPTDAESRQRAIQGITAFIQPILDLACEVTGWKGSFVLGGPEPAKNGELTILSVHSGETKGDVKMNFGRSERAWYKDHFVRAYGSFLRKCYSPEDCRTMSLGLEAVVEALDAQEMDAAGASVDGFSWERPGDVLNAATPSASVGTSSALPRKSLTSDHQQVQGSRTPPPPQQHSPSIPSVVQVASSLNGNERSGLLSQAMPIPRPVSPATPGLGHLNHVFQMPDSPNAPNVRASIAPMSPSVLPASPVLSASSPSTEHSLQPPGKAAQSPSTQTEAQVDRSLPLNSSIPVNKVSSNIDAIPILKRKRGARGDGANAPTGGSGEKDNKRPKNGTKTKTREIDALPARRTSLPSASTASSTFTSVAVLPTLVPSSAPDWFKSTHSMLSTANLGPQWAELLRKWVEFEIQEEYKKTPLLKATHRPEQIAKWVKNYRSPTFRLPISDLSTYSDSFINWWTSLQPDWRLENDAIVFSRLDGDWSTLRRSGVNGLVGILVALLFWGERLSEQQFNTGRWADMVADVTHVCEHLRV